MSSAQPAGATRYCAPLTAAEARAFIPFMHRLIGTAFAVIRPLFMSGTAIISKADDSPVTQADRGAEAAMRALIERTYPDHGVLGEEYGTRESAGRYRWVLDPVDGTRAFITHCFLFGTLIALERDDGAGFRPVLGCIAHPAAGLALIGHAGRTQLFASDGSHRTARVRPCADLAQATVLSTSYWTTAEQRGAPNAARIGELVSRAKLARTWGDCFGYFALATGGADLMLDPTLAYWDVAAIVPVVEGAGGCVTSWTGGDPLAQPSLIASAGPLHAPVLALLHGSR
jgi:histidinol phosphatase-like enzyme (inositol monophosphatase family)